MAATRHQGGRARATRLVSALALAALATLSCTSGVQYGPPQFPTAQGVVCGGVADRCCTPPALCHPGLACLSGKCEPPPVLAPCETQAVGLQAALVCPAGEGCTAPLGPGDAGPVPGCAQLCPLGAADAGCPPQEVCQPEPGDPAVGACLPVCFDSSSCAKGFACDDGGICRCASDAACRAFGPSARCTPEGFCAAGCASDLECGCGSICADGGACAPGCGSDADCCGGRCQSGQCLPAAPGAPGDRCYSGSCAPGLVCTGAIPSCTAVPSGASCTFTGCDCGGDGGGCDPGCVGYGCPCTPSTCPAGTVCETGQMNWSTTEEQGFAVCLLPCALDGGACPPGASCAPSVTEPSQGVCEPLSPDAGPCAKDADCQATHPAATCRAGLCLCQPDCAGRSCGLDGCGGLCGSCPAGEACGASGQCVPAFCGGPNFVVQCPDGRLSPNGGSCPDAGGASSSCLPGYHAVSCDGGVCQGDCSFPDWWCAPCTPSCGGNQCGSDGCGGSCGSCPAGETCASGRCATPGSGGGGGGGPSGATGCSPPCGAGEACVGSGGAPSCVTLCSADAQCPGGCCGSLRDGRRVCLGSSYCAGSSCTQCDGTVCCSAAQNCCPGSCNPSCASTCRDCTSECCAGIDPRSCCPATPCTNQCAGCQDCSTLCCDSVANPSACCASQPCLTAMSDCACDSCANPCGDPCCDQTACCYGC